MLRFAGRIYRYGGMFKKPLTRRAQGNYGNFPGYVLLHDDENGKTIKARADCVMLVL